jgi:hypothetical protein
MVVLMPGLLALQIVAGHGQATWCRIDNGLLDYYPMDSVKAGITTEDVVGGRSLMLANMNSNNVVSASHPGMGGSSNCLYFSQSGGPTLAYYNSTGQNPLTGGGDFLPFINQRGATMSFWIKGNEPASTEKQFFGECANDGEADPIFLISAASTYPIPSNSQALFRLRDTANATDPNGVACIQMPNGTYELPAPGNYWLQVSNYTANPVLDGNWHMFTMTIDSNAVVQVYVDGIRDTGSGGFTDPSGESVTCPPLWTTNYYYTTNNYPTTGSPNPPPNGFVRWMMNGLYNNNSGITTFGGYIRNGVKNSGLVCQMNDLGFWNRVLEPDEIMFLATNESAIVLPVNCSLCLPAIANFSANPSTVHPGEMVTIQWDIQAVTSEPILSLSLDPAIGEVTNVTSYVNGVGATNITVFTNTTFVLSLTNIDSCGDLIGQPSTSISVTVVPLELTPIAYLASDSSNADNPSFTVAWNSISNNTYSVQRTLNLSNPVWTTLATGLPSEGSSTSYTDTTMESNSTAYYRITSP